MAGSGAPADSIRVSRPSASTGLPFVRDQAGGQHPLEVRHGALAAFQRVHRVDGVISVGAVGTSYASVSHGPTTAT